MDPVTYLAVFAGMLHFSTFVLYNRQVIQGRSKPNTATWFLWVFLAVMNTSSYQVMSGDWIKTIIPIASTVACCFTFLFALIQGKLSRLNFWDSAAVVIGLASGLVWWLFQSAFFANMALQVVIAVSFVPTIRSVVTNPDNEKGCLPWFIWSSVYLIGLFVVLLRWQGQYEDLVYPINLMVLHGTVGVLSIKGKKGI